MRPTPRARSSNPRPRLQVSRPEGEGATKGPPSGVRLPVPLRNGLDELSDEPIQEGPVIFSTSYHYRGPRTYFSAGLGLVSTVYDYFRCDDSERRRTRGRTAAATRDGRPHDDEPGWRLEWVPANQTTGNESPPSFCISMPTGFLAFRVSPLAAYPTSYASPVRTL